MRKQQLESLKKKVGLNHPLLENGLLLHIKEPVGGFNEWTVLSYNLLILGQYIRENIELRKEIVELMDTYIKRITALGCAWSGNVCSFPDNNQAQAFSGHCCCPTDSSNVSLPNYMLMMLGHRLDENEKRLGRLEDMLKNRLGGW